MRTVQITGPGLLDAINKVIVTARIQGFLLFIGADRNDEVKQGRMLAELSSSDLRNQLAVAQADAQAAKSAIAEAESDRERAAATLTKATQDFNRRTALVKLNVVSEAEFTNSQAALREAQANHAKASTAVERVTAQAASAAANVNVLQAKLADATIRSPINGVVTSRERNVGDLLSPGATLMQIIDPASIVVSARFDESAMAAVRPGQHAEVRFTSDPDRIVEGEVLRLIRQVDQETREFSADITLHGLPKNWAIGQRATVTVEAQYPSFLMAIPKDYVARRDGRPGVWLSRGSRAVWVPVALGYLSGSSIEIKHGLQVGDVVLDPGGRYYLEPVALNGPSK